MEATTSDYLLKYEILKSKIMSMQSRHNEMAFNISRLIDENKRLTNDLKESALIREQYLSETGFDDLEHQFRAAVASKNAAVEMWQTALQQLEIREELLSGKRSIVESERAETGKTIEHLKREYTKGLNVLSAELTNYRSELATTKQTLHSTTTQLEGLRTEFDSVTKQLSKSKQSEVNLRQTVTEIENKTTVFQADLSESQEAIKKSKLEICSLKEINQGLLTDQTNLAEVNEKLKKDMAIMKTDVKESLLTAKEAILQKKEAAFREEETLKEIQHLKASIDIEIEKNAFKYKSEIKDVHKQSTEKIQSLMEEINSLHVDVSDRQSLFEKAVRENQALELKLEAFYLESSDGAPTDSKVLDDLCKRLTLTEKLRDEHEFKTKNLELELREFKVAKEQELTCTIEERELLKDQLHKMLEDFNEACSDRVRLSDEMMKLKKKCHDQEKEVKSYKAKYMHDVSALREEIGKKQQTFSEKLAAKEEHCKKLLSDFQLLLDAEFKVCSRWKEECKSIVSQSELKLSELCQHLALLQNQNGELANIIQKNNLCVPDHIVLN